ncbi:Ada metal-binding domain-containing protein [Ligilactobacillus ruminis]|uniref:Ada DNA repair metal-binding domain-containing protein n=1 Tax=Ligilactobacillus ruminis TaxID=1623 RepID=A0A6A8GSW8_9LACO|nr:hypothetical protein [Ligilactobacillus ruminis]MSA22099.1 hypothetical protein [Ligilactobacillus ruminis]MSA24086.1 hypothetical protein [Ligilactobacillus ruminis]MSA34217.1 hypothetical protein [Ligilactobacillus ruminis]MSA40648.1 hypothetical protein [Ligilactobacillus ruminis]
MWQWNRCHGNVILASDGTLLVPYRSGFFCVKSTGVFCRASCRSKIPKRDNVFFESVQGNTFF